MSDTSRNTKTDKKGTSHSHGIYTLEFITTDEQHQGQGAASRQLKVLCQLADRWSITLRVRVLAHETSRLNDEQLTAWYQRYHFTEVDGLYLNRLPAQRRPK